MRTEALVITVLLLLFAQGCVDGSSGSLANDNPPGGTPIGDGDGGGNEGDPGGTPGPGAEACYAGTGGGGVCFPVINLVNDPDYEYGDPYQDPTFPGGFDPRQYRRPLRVIDLARADARELLAPHFQMVELMNVERGRYGLFSPAVLRIIEALRVSLGRPINVNSGYRNPGRNGNVGGVKWSRHVYGDAIDFYSTGA